MLDVSPMQNGAMVSPAQVFLFENHDQSYAIWREHQLRNRILIHVDAHHDMYGRWPTKDNSLPPITIANYIYPAVAEGIVREVVWVVPDQTLKSRAGRRWCEETTRRISPRDPSLKKDDRSAKLRRGTVVLGKPLRFCTLDDLPTFNEPVLLDIDVDYLTSTDATFKGIQCYGDRPWIWPQELLERLKRSGLTTDMVTIAQSVNGGYTPLQWKYLGDELVALISGGAMPAQLTAAASMRQATQAVAQQDLPTAEAKYTDARSLWPQLGAPALHLAHLNAQMGRLDDAQAFYNEALERDSSYRTPFNSAGLWYFEERRDAEATAAFQRTLTLDPADPHAQWGLGLVALRRKRWAEAEQLFRKALAGEPQSVDAQRGLGRALAKQRRNTEAIKAYEKSLMLILTGRRSILDYQILTNAAAGYVSDPLHAQVHARLGDLYLAQGDTKTAISAYRMGIAMGEDNLTARLKLINIYLRQKEWGKSVRQVVPALQRIPTDLQRGARILQHKVKRQIKTGWRGITQPRTTKHAPSLWC